MEHVSPSIGTSSSYPVPLTKEIRVYMVVFPFDLRSDDTDQICSANSLMIDSRSRKFGWIFAEKNTM